MEHALSYFAGSLDEAGFSVSATTYQEMAGVVVGQRLWAEEEGVDEFDARFRNVGELAQQVHQLLYPYVEAMERLSALLELAPEPPPELDPESLAGRIVTVLADSDRPISVTALRALVSEGTKAVRRALRELEEQGIAQRYDAGGRSLYGLAGVAGESLDKAGASRATR